MKFNIISAMIRQNRGIGFKGGLPWAMKDMKLDMQRFKQLTTDTFIGSQNAVIMGRLTFESLPKGMLLNRVNVVISSQHKDLKHPVSGENPFICSSLDNALEFLQSHSDINTAGIRIDKVFVIGGQRLYETAIKHPKCEKLILTEIDDFTTKYEVDTYFPKIPPWFIETTEEIITSNDINGFKNTLRFVEYKNISYPNSPENQYLDLLKDILENGEKVQGDRTGVGCITSFAKQIRFNIGTNVNELMHTRIQNENENMVGHDGVDFSQQNQNQNPNQTQTRNPYSIDWKKMKYRVPMLTTKKIFLPGIVWELLWMLRGSTDAKWLQEREVHIWDGNTSREFLDKQGLYHLPEGSIGEGYGHLWCNYGGDVETGEGGVNQVTRIIDDLRTKPKDRRIMMNVWRADRLDKAVLPPCHFVYMFHVSNHQNQIQKLNCQMIMRSSDTFLGLPFNILSTAFLTILISRCTGMIPGEIVISTNNSHIYTNHIDAVKKQMDRTPIRFPELVIDKTIENYDDFLTMDLTDFDIQGYKSYPGIKAQMAI
jgi:dihydrofolate reductase/thymidylate synthase